MVPHLGSELVHDLVDDGTDPKHDGRGDAVHEGEPGHLLGPVDDDVGVLEHHVQLEGDVDDMEDVWGDGHLRAAAQHLRDLPGSVVQTEDGGILGDDQAHVHHVTCAEHSGCSLQYDV